MSGPAPGERPVSPDMLCGRLRRRIPSATKTAAKSSDPLDRETIEAAAELAVGGDGAVGFGQLDDLGARHLTQGSQELFLRAGALVRQLAWRLKPYAGLVEET